MNETRRTLLKAGTHGALLAGLIGLGVLRPTQALAADWNKAAFEAKKLDEALKAIGADTATEHKDVVLKVPEIAENGAVVPVEIISTLMNVVSIAIFVDKNPFPLAANFNLSNGAMPFMSTRLKMGQTSLVRAVMKTADGKHYSAQKEIKVTVGGCGG